MKIFQNLYSLILGIIIGFSLSITALVSGVLALVCMGYYEKTKQDKKPVTFTQQNYTAPKPKPFDFRDGVRSDRMFEADRKEVNSVINYLTTLAARQGYALLRDFYIVTDKRGKGRQPDNVGWTADDLTIDKIDIVTDAEKEGNLTLILPPYRILPDNLVNKQ